MVVVLAESPVSKRNDVTMKIDAEVARMAKIVAEFEGKSGAEYVSEILRPIVKRDLEKHSRKFLDADSGEPNVSKGRRKGNPE